MTSLRPGGSHCCVVPAQGVKLEQFIFDPFPQAETPVLVEVARDAEFAPVKNAPGSPSDSPDTARAALLALHTRCSPSQLLHVGRSPTGGHTQFHGCL